MSVIIPGAKPKLSPNKVNELLDQHGITDKVAMLGVRGYRRDTMGKPGVNDSGIYDDAIFLRWPGEMLPFNANCDPSRIGWNAALGKPFAQLKTGIWPFVRGMHKGKYSALRQPDEEQAARLCIANHGHFTVIRNDGKGHRYEDEGYHAINIHMGSNQGTSSWGCQTLPPAEWTAFIATVYAQMKRTGQTVISYCLLDGPLC